MLLKCHTAESIKTETHTCPLNVSWWTLQSLLSVLRLQETGNLFGLLLLPRHGCRFPIFLLEKNKIYSCPETPPAKNDQTCT